MALDVQIKRIYDPTDPDDGYRVLIDHIWPRGVSRERARLDEWARELAPSDELRRWFDHVPERFEEFRTRYRAELRRNIRHDVEHGKHRYYRLGSLDFIWHDNIHCNADVKRHHDAGPDAMRYLDVSYIMNANVAIHLYRI